MVVLGLPLFNPDLFWHLSAGRWIWAHGAVPTRDSFTFTAYGAPWIDFEWGTQVLWSAVERAGGLWGLWLLKIALLVAAFWPVDGLLRDKKVPAAGRAGALALWTGAMLAQADLRADLPTAIFFAVLLRRLEARRASFLFGFGLFALWANLHAGFVLGLVLYALYAAAARPAPAGLYAEGFGALFGSALNPYGLRLYRILGEHSAAPALSKLIIEWAPPTVRHPFQIPLLAAAAVVLGAAAVVRRRGPLAFAAVVLALAALASARFGAYFAAAGAAFLFSEFPSPPAWALEAGLAALTVLLAAPVATARFDLPFHDNYVARRACDFVARERGALGGLRLFNQYEWGGYLGWVEGPDARVFGDGRYLFLGQLAEERDAWTGKAQFDAWAARYALDGFVIRHFPLTMPATRAYPDGATRTFQRPWFVSFLPRERWALVYWDDQALVFVDRAKVPAAWLAAHEYRWDLPGDEAARADALARGEVPREALAAEEARHAAEVPPR